MSDEKNELKQGVPPQQPQPPQPGSGAVPNPVDAGPVPVPNPNSPVPGTAPIDNKAEDAAKKEANEKKALDELAALESNKPAEKDANKKKSAEDDETPKNTADWKKKVKDTSEMHKKLEEKQPELDEKNQRSIKEHSSKSNFLSGDGISNLIMALFLSAKPKPKVEGLKDAEKKMDAATEGFEKSQKKDEDTEKLAIKTAERVAKQKKTAPTPMPSFAKNAQEEQLLQQQQQQQEANRTAPPNP